MVGDMILTKALNSNAVEGLIHKFIPLMTTILKYNFRIIVVVMAPMARWLRAIMVAIMMLYSSLWPKKKLEG